METKDRIAFIDYIRVAACLMVMLVHASENFYGADTSGLAGSMSMLANEQNRLWVAFYDGALSRVAVPLFMIVSAFLLVPMRQGVTMHQFYRRRFLRILPPFVLFLLLYTFLPLLWGGMTWEQSQADLRLLPFNFPSMGGHLWFMYPLISLYLIIPVVSPWLERASARDERVFLYIFAFSTLIPWLHRFVSPELWGECFWNQFSMLWYCSGYLGYLVLAHYIRVHLAHWTRDRRLRVGTACFVIGAAFTAWSFWWKGEPGKLIETPMLEWSWEFCTPNVLLATFGLFLLFTCIRRRQAPALIVTLSRLSFGMYLMHLFFLAPIATWLIGGNVADPLLPTWLAIPTIAILTFLCCAITTRLLSLLPGSKYFVGVAPPSPPQEAPPSPPQGGDVASPSPPEGGDVYIDNANMGTSANQTPPPSGGLGGALFLLLLAVPSAAQEAVVTERFTTSEGLSDNSVLCALRDSYGLLWVGTENGLNCFDGQRIRVYRDMVTSENPNETNAVMSLYELNGDLWFGGSAGLYVFNRFTNTYSRFTEHTRYGVVIASTVPKIVGQDHLVWIATMGQGIFIYDTADGTLTQDSRHGNFFSDITVGSDGLVYAVTLNGQLSVFRSDGQFLRTYDVKGYDFDKERISIVHSGGDLWLAYGTHLLKLNPSARQADPQAELPTLGAIHAMVDDSRGRLLLGSDNGAYVWTPESGQLERIDGHDSASQLTDIMVNGLMWDADSTLLAFTHTGGLNSITIQQRGLKFIPLPGDGEHNVAHALCRGTDGQLWIGTDQGLYRGDALKPLVEKDSRVPSYEINTLLLDDDDLWIGTRHNGIQILNLKTGQVSSHTFSNTQPYTIPSNEVHNIFRTSQGDIYVLTSWGLSSYERSTGYFHGYSSISAMTPFICMEEVANGWLWASSVNRGLFYKRFKNGLFDAFHSSAIGRQTVTLMLSDQQGDLWVATDGGGLYRYDAGQGDFVRYDDEGTVLHGQVVNFMEEDEQGALWLGTQVGIVRISPSRDIQGMQVYRLPPHSSYRHQQRLACTHGQGDLLLGGNGGVFRITTDELTANADRQRAYIHELSLPYAADNRAELQRLGLDVLLYTRSEIQLPYADNSFSLHFASAHYSGAPTPKYEYMLQGFDRTWVHATTTSEATYANLPPGNYEFLLRLVGQADEADVARLRIVILPPWYRTTLAYLLYVLLIAAIVVGAYYLTQRRLKRRYRRQMQQFLQQQEKETFQSKIRFFIDLVHEIRTPLTLMSLPLEEVENTLKAPPSPLAPPSPPQGGDVYIDKANQTSSPLGGLGEACRHGEANRLGEAFSAIHRNMDYLLGITNQLLDFQKQENGGITLMRRPTDMKAMLQHIYDQFSYAAEMQGKQLLLQMPDEAVILSVDEDKMTRVLMNLVGNALKYAKTRMVVRLANDTDVTIAIIDDGQGVPTQERDRIFDRYYQIANDNVATSVGTGLGLAYAKMLAEAHGGDLTYEDAPGGGSCFTLALKAPTSHQAPPSPPEGGDVYIDNANVGALSNQTSPPSGGLGDAFRILLVEDNDELLKVTSNALRQWYKVVKARDGVEALDVLKYQEVDVIVSDVMMPRMDGIELCRQLKENIETSHLPVILLTAKVSVAAKTEGMESGADIYLEKPFSIRQLHAQIENLLRLRQQFYERMRSLDGFHATAADTADKPLGLNQQDLQFIEALQKSVEQNMSDEEFSIDTLAEQLNLSRSSFYRKMKALTGLTPTDYLKTSRMNQAARLLRTGLRSSEVCERVGFTSTSYFAKCFRAQFGCLPKDFV